MTTPGRVETNEKVEYDPTHLAPDQAPLDPLDSREAAHRLTDDLEILRAERLVSNQEHENEIRRSRSRNRSQHGQEEDAFNTTTPPAPPVPQTPQKSTALIRFLGRVKKFPRFIRYFTYLTPVAIILLIPILLDIYAYDYHSKPVGGRNGVQLLWFGIWLEVVWLTLWGARLLTGLMPSVFGFLASNSGSSNHNKWKEIGRQLEIHTALFVWLLVVLSSFLPIVNHHRVLSDDADPKHLPHVSWISIVNKVIISLFVLAALNFAEKILIQWIATSFHLRTYSHRIAQNRMEANYLVQLYTYATMKLEAQDPVWDSSGNALSSGMRTPMRLVQDNARHAWSKVGDVANRMAGDFTGRKILRGNHPQKVVMELLRTTASSHTLARVFYRTFVRPEHDTITLEDLQPAFAAQEDAETCFAVFDKDLNGDISMEELELVCNEIHLEKKAIAASLKDLDSVVKKLDRVFLVIIVIISAIVFASIISDSAAAALTSTGTVVLGLAWVLQATAQEFLQSIIFVFVKHPFDVGDRVTVYGNTGNMMRGDDYYVQEISLLYTEFKKMEGHTVQAPNSVLNSLFILNQRRSNGLADPVELKLRFGTSEETIEELKARMLAFVTENKRDYAPRIITEVRTIDEVYSMTMNFIFFHKSSFQNELLRLQRHNKFAVELMRQIRDLGIEGPRAQQPGGVRDWPIYHQVVQPPSYETMERGGGDFTPQTPNVPRLNSPAALRRRADSRAAAVNAVHDFGDVYDNRRPDNTMTRLASIRQAPDHVVGSSALDRVQSRASGAGSESTRRRNMWGRSRSRSNAMFQGPGPGPTASNMV